MTDEEGTLRDILEGRLKGKSAVMEVLDAAEGKTLDVKIRDVHEEEPPIGRALRRNHCFGNVNGLMDYLFDYKSENTVVFADPENLSMEIVLDEDSSWRQEVVGMRPAVHPLWKPWRGICGNSDNLRNIVDFLRHNRSQIIEPNGRELVLTLSQIKGSTEFELHEGIGNGSVNGLLIKSKVQGNKDTGLVELPESIKIRCPIFVDQKEVDTEIDLILETKMADGKPVVLATLNASDLRTAELEQFQEMCQGVSEFCKENDLVFTYGRCAYRDWD